MTTVLEAVTQSKRFRNYRDVAPITPFACAETTSLEGASLERSIGEWNFACSAWALLEHHASSSMCSRPSLGLPAEVEPYRTVKPINHKRAISERISR
jgi:hypothetical protein